MSLTTMNPLSSSFPHLPAATQNSSVVEALFQNFTSQYQKERSNDSEWITVREKDSFGSGGGLAEDNAWNITTAGIFKEAHHHHLENEFSDASPFSSSWEEAFRDSSRFWVQRVLVPIVVIIGVLGNAVTIYILTRRPMRSSTNVYLSALAVSDLLFLLFSFSMSWRHYPSMNTIWFYWLYTPFGLWMADAASSTSVWIIVSFTIERYIAVCHPMRGKIFCTEERAIRVAVIVYLICFALTASTPLEWRATIASNETDSMNETVYTYTLENTEFGNNETYRLIYHWFTTIFFVFLPVVILAIFNFFLIQAVRRSRIARKRMTNSQISTARQLQIIRQENRITLILIVVVIVFLLCQMPTAVVLIYTSIHIVELGSAEDNILRGLGNIFNLLVAINAACNFLLYTALSDKYRKYFCNFFLCRSRRHMRNASRQFDGSPYELDTMDPTMNFTRATSLRLDYNPMSHNNRRQQLHGELRRANTYTNSRYLQRQQQQNGLRAGSSGFLHQDSFGGRSSSLHMNNMKDSTIPLIKIEQV